MLMDKTVKIKWNPRIKKYYESLGYTYTKMNDDFDADIKDITSGCCSEVTVKCDYCGKIYTKRWCNYIKENSKSNIQKDCCIKCRKNKIQESVSKTYGVNSVLSLGEIQEKVKATNISKYGVENPFAADDIKKAIRLTCTERYGSCSPMKNKTIQDKVSNTCMQRYGVKYYVLTQKYRGSDNPRWKGGVSRERSERFTYDYIIWRKSVFDRDKYTCQCCGARNGNGKTVKLNAHHIYNWNDNENMRFKADNGITLCENCHKLFHSEFGKRENTKDQLDKFLRNHGKKVC